MSVIEENWQTTKPTIRERSKHMFNNDLFSDVKFVVRGGPNGKSESKQVIPAHKFVLSGLLIDSTNLWAGITCLLSLSPLRPPRTTNFTSLKRSLLNMYLLLSLIVGFVVCQFLSITDMALGLQSARLSALLKALFLRNSRNWLNWID